MKETPDFQTGSTVTLSTVERLCNKLPACRYLLYA